MNLHLWQLEDAWRAQSQGRQVLAKFTFFVKRDNLLGQTMIKLKQMKADRVDAFKLPINVQFEGEPGQDMGGVRREFFSLLLKELFTENFGMFRHNEDVQLYWINGHADYFDSVPAERKEQLESYFELFGNIVGLAIFNGTQIDFPLPFFFFKLKFRGIQSIGLEDYAQWQPETAKSLQFMLDYDKEDEQPLEDVVCRTFTVDVLVGDQNQTVELIPDGDATYVNFTNREEFVRLFIEFDVLRQTQTRFDAFWRGLSRFIDPMTLTELFDIEELPTLIAGQQALNYDELKKGSRYGGGFNLEHRMIKWFWELVIEEWSDEQRRLLLQFSTGTDRAPVNGLMSLKFAIVKEGGCDDKRLPSSHTCFNALHMPEYTSKAVLQRNLEVAIANATGFGFA